MSSLHRDSLAPGSQEGGGGRKREPAWLPLSAHALIFYAANHHARAMLVIKRHGIIKTFQAVKHGLTSEQSSSWVTLL